MTTVLWVVGVVLTVGYSIVAWRAWISGRRVIERLDRIMARLDGAPEMDEYRWGGTD